MATDNLKRSLQVGDTVWIPYYGIKKYGVVELAETAVKDFILVKFDLDEESTAVWSGDVIKLI